jgi:hypothetical protein
VFDLGPPIAFVRELPKDFNVTTFGMHLAPDEWERLRSHYEGAIEPP